ncbi:hypothetical protein ABWL39_12785, partial [Chitinivorax sp. PXF-14]|uniref:hypothetical protein n=1 Tax=Chitinivorax sp. PXF-14 TaxID=3230488 RepID=UPI003467E8DD
MTEAEWRLRHQVIAARLPAPDPVHPEWFGEEYSPTAYWLCRKEQSADHRGIADCDRHRLRRN